MQTQGTQSDRGAGWRVFAGIMLVIVGFLNLIDAIVAITNATYYQHLANNAGFQLPVTNNIHTWGWVELALSVILIIAGFVVLSLGPAFISRTIGVIFASLNIVFQLAYLAHFPFWSFTMIIIDILIIYGLIAHVETYETR
jgi:multisubunit Na+/H+ antiporter MnhF subunit